MRSREFELAVVLHKGEEGGYWVSVPAVPGCYSQGETVEEAMANIKEALELHLECSLEDGEDMPQERQLGYTVRISLPVPV